MKQETLISFIIPCYHAFSMMRPCLSFFEKHSSESFEVIIVDDCSTDGSFEQLVLYAKTCPYALRVFRNEQNSGPGVSRNRGMENAVGRYITFIDADDCCFDDYFNSVTSFLNGKNDCVVFDFVYRYENQSDIRYSVFLKPFSQGGVDTASAVVFLRGGTCGKLYLRSRIIESGVRFLPQYRHEDIPFTKSLVSFCDKIVYVKRPLYIYCRHNLSLMHNESKSSPENAERSFAYISGWIAKRYPDELEAIFMNEYFVNMAAKNAFLMNRKDWRSYVDETESQYPNCLANKYFSDFPRLRKIAVYLVHFKMYRSLRLLEKAKKKFR